jgi:hypothetical protein
MRSALVAFAVAFAAGLVVLLAIGVLEQRSEAFTLGVAPTSPLTLPHGGEVCQRSIERPTPFSRVRLELASRRRSTPDLHVRVFSRDRLLAGGPSSGALGGRRAVVVTVGDVPAGARISVCVRNSGRRAVQLYGNSGMANPTSAAFRGGTRVDFDMDLAFLRPTDVSLISLVGDIVSRASLFRGEWIGAWTVWVVMALLLTAFPLLLYRALDDVERNP